MAQADTSWFNDLPAGKMVAPPPTAPNTPAPAAAAVQTPTSVVTPTKTGQTDTSWFDALPAGKAAAPAPSSPTAQPGEQQTTEGHPSAPFLYPGETTTTPAPAAPTAEQTPSWANLGGAIPSGLYRGVAGAANIPTTLANAPLAIAQGLGIGTSDRFKPVFNENPTNYKPVGSLASNLENSAAAVSNVASLGGIAGAAAPLFDAASAPGIAARALSQTSPGTLGAAALAGGVEEPLASTVPEEYRPLVRIGANLASGGLTSGLDAAGSAATRGITPETAQLAQLGRDTYSLPIRGGQISGNRMVRATDSVLQSIPMSGHGGLDDEMQSAFNRAISNTIGENATKITPEVMQNARTRIGGVLQDVENRNAVNFDDPLQNDLSGIEANARNSLTDPEYAVIQRQLNNVMGRVGDTDQIAGTTYGNLMHKGAPLDAAANSANPNIANFAGDIRNALRDSLTRSLSGDDLAAYQGARTQWKNMRTIEPLTLRADIVGGASPATGDIIPAQLRGVVNRSYSNSAYASPGDIPLNDLANIGQRFLKEPNTSQTSERTNIMRWLERGGAAAGALVGGEHYLGVSPMEMALPAAGAAVGTVGLARGAGSVLRSDWYANRLINKAMTPDVSTPGIPGVSVPLLTSSGMRQLSPPSASQQPSINPLTGIPEFSLKANQDQAAEDLSTTGIAHRIAAGGLVDHTAVQQWINTNKRDLRQTYGGQGIQNIAATAALIRKPGTMFSLLNAQEPSPRLLQAMSESGVKVPEDLLATTISSPALTKLLSTRVGGEKLTNAAESRLIAAVKLASQTKGPGNEPDGNGDAGLRSNPPDGGGVRPVPQGNQSPVSIHPAQITAARIPQESRL